MANTNPYRVRNGRITSAGLDLEDLNELIVEHDYTPVDELVECDCSSRSTGFTVDDGDKWCLRWCANCGGVYGRHYARADYL